MIRSKSPVKSGNPPNRHGIFFLKKHVILEDFMKTKSTPQRQPMVDLTEVTHILNAQSSDVDLDPFRMWGLILSLLTEFKLACSLLSVGSLK
ncbi:MAG TPA: hypothetical protein EYQ50_19855 [Verrucomicrobiales bacterium]|nr:hypothetical protein [Verrucomicrobiales bacterium]HIL69999.1 hypothetical protein [Verrucomicrobiota bacterium]